MRSSTLTSIINFYAGMYKSDKCLSIELMKHTLHHLLREHKITAHTADKALQRYYRKVVEEWLHVQS